jgi:hypothetical protein
MSSKSKQGKQLKVPREIKEIEAEYQRLCYESGALQYQIQIYQNELKQKNFRLEAINKEGAARQQLDSTKTKAEAPKENNELQSNESGPA